MIKKIAEKIKPIPSVIIKLLALMLEDLLILSGLTLLNVTTYKINVNAGLYATSLTLLGLGVFFSIHPIKGVRK